MGKKIKYFNFENEGEFYFFIEKSKMVEVYGEYFKY